MIVASILSSFGSSISPNNNINSNNNAFQTQKFSSKYTDNKEYFQHEFKPKFNMTHHLYSKDLYNHHNMTLTHSPVAVDIMDTIVFCMITYLVIICTTFNNDTDMDKY